ncbi:hypothetical protein ACFYWY_33215 [Streptomyces sp. NPDC002870]|uniref:hypothetical protein n=1 Tax=Streptomyces sp. NPDC002870 TaxID=3364666 RepID=UPI00369AEF9E
MTLTTGRGVRPGWRKLGGFLLESGAMAPDWAQAFEAVDRARFLPSVMWPYDMATRTSSHVDRDADPDAWYAAADADVPVTTQWDDGRHHGTAPGSVPTSSASMPSVPATASQVPTGRPRPIPSITASEPLVGY